MKCITDNNKVCPHLKFNQKGNYAFHCNYHKDRLVQICEDDLRRNFICPIDVEKAKKCQ
jgi:hypothetical protein